MLFVHAAPPYGSRTSDFKKLNPTYQLHAYMAKKKTAPREGLRLAGLVTMEWLRQRLGDHAPDEFLRLQELCAGIYAV